MWNGTMFVDLDWPLNASSLLSASAELLVFVLQMVFLDDSGGNIGDNWHVLKLRPQL